MRILSPRGRILSVRKVTPFAERVDTFNGRNNNCTEIAQNMSVIPTGLQFELEGDKGIFCDASLYIGNLAPEKVCEIQKALLKDGVYDFSAMEYQKDALPMDVVIDGGVSLPYFNENELMCGWDARFGSPVTYRQGKQEDDFEDEEETDAEE